MSNNLTRGMYLALVISLVVCFFYFIKTDSVKQVDQQNIGINDISAQEFDLIIQKKIKTSSVFAISIEKYATDTLKKEIEKLRKEKEILNGEIERQIKEKEIFRAGTEALREDKKQLSQQILQLSQERDQVREFNAAIPGYQQKVFELEARVSALMNEQKNIQIREEAQKPPSIISSENIETVLVRLENTDMSKVAYFKIVNKKTGKFFVYEVPPALILEGQNIRELLINLIPGEYTVQVNRPYDSYRLPPPQAFIVSEEPIAEINNKKIHALLQY